MVQCLALHADNHCIQMQGTANATHHQLVLLCAWNTRHFIFIGPAFVISTSDQKFPDYNPNLHLSIVL